MKLYDLVKLGELEIGDRFQFTGRQGPGKALFVVEQIHRAKYQQGHPIEKMTCGRVDKPFSKMVNLLPDRIVVFIRKETPFCSNEFTGMQDAPCPVQFETCKKQTT